MTQYTAPAAFDPALAAADRSVASLITLVSPVMTKEKYAEQSGLKPGAIRGQWDRIGDGFFRIPKIKIGRLNLVNVAQLVREPVINICAPTMTIAFFACISGLRGDQIEAQIKEHNLPVIMTGHKTMVDIASLYQRCLDAPLAPLA